MFFLFKANWTTLKYLFLFNITNKSSILKQDRPREERNRMENRMEIRSDRNQAVEGTDAFKIKTGGHVARLLCERVDPQYSIPQLHSTFKQ